MSTFRKPQKPPEPPKNNERNEYIPSFISKKPFYIDDATASEDDYLEHQRLQGQKNSDPLATAAWYDRGKRTGPAATKYRKGACENCGAMGHKQRDCLQKKRKFGAKYTGKDIQADEAVQDIKLGWDAKRDRWNGVDAKEYDKVVEEYNAMEEMRKTILGKDKSEGEGTDGQDLDGDKYAEETDMGRHQPTSTRQLRLREDTAKYLLNLDLDSAKYDPKTRSMLDPGLGGDASSALVAEEGFQRASGDAAEFERANTYAWEAQERGDPNAIHLQANPTAGAITRKKEMEEAAAKKEAQRKLLLEKYGAQDVATDKPSEVIENEKYVEYDERGKVKGQPQRKIKSMYVEDVYINNHTSVWGSWWRDFKWGYACCHSIIKNSYCVGPDGLKAMEEAEQMAKGAMLTKAEAIVPDPIPIKQEVDHKQEVTKKRTLREMTDAVTEEQMEEYMRKRTAADDPMAAYVNVGRHELGADSS